MTTHTKGPWKLDGNLGCKRITAKPYARQQHRQAKRMELACTSGLSNEAEDRANGMIMAAAPDLMEALDEMLLAFEAFMKEADWGRSALSASTIYAANAAPMQARTALAKARGR